MRYLATHEETVRGTTDFPIGFYHVDASHPRYEMPFHWHMEHELLRVVRGAFSLSVDGDILHLCAGDVALIPSGAVHGGVPEDCVYECLVFDCGRLLCGGTLCSADYRRLFSGENALQVFYPHDSPTARRAEMLCDTLGKEEESGFAAVGLLWLLFGGILQDHCYEKRDESTREHPAERMKDVLRWMRIHYAEHLTLEQLSTVAGMSSEHFCRVFHRVTGRSPINYLNYYRSECAAELLCFTDKSVTEIAYACGFFDQSYFQRIFKRYKHTTPGDYRRTHRA